MTLSAPLRHLAPTGSARARRRPLPLTDVTIDDAFWSPRRARIRTATLRQQLEHLRTGGQFQALTLTWRPGDPGEPHIFWESDVAKWIEAASYCLAAAHDPDLDAAVDEAIELLAGAQQPDGYLNVYFTVVRPGQRFTDLRDAHELYCAGHLIEAGVAHYQATGKTSLLDIVCRYADLLHRVFGPGGACAGGYDGHQEIELALVKLGRVTCDRRYLDTALRMIDARGQQPFYYEAEEQRRGAPGYFDAVFPHRVDNPQRFREYNQSHAPVRDQDEAVGHSVRAMYMYSAMTDLALDFNDKELLEACHRLWENTTGRKMYLTGGLGSDHSIEGFGGPYDLPDEHGYAETCAAIGLVQWASRMANATADASFVDVAERALYNGVLSGASADGTSYFYGNPLASNGSVHRHEWFGVACCPPNLARLISSLQYYIYSESDRELAVNLYISGSATIDIDGNRVTVTQQTSEPGGGIVDLIIETAGRTVDFELSLRIPAWTTSPVLTVNGQSRPVDTTAGYLTVSQEWNDGDTLQLHIPASARRVWANTHVASTAGKVALERGPFVYCVEGVDHEVAVSALALPRAAEITEIRAAEDAPMNLACDARMDYNAGDTDTLYRLTSPAAQDTRLHAVPYFSWANRGVSTMAVWIREDAHDQ